MLGKKQLSVWGARLAHALAASGRIDEARPHLERFAANGFDLPIDCVWISAMACWAATAIECGESEYAGPLLERLSPWREQLSHNGLTIEGPVSLFLGGLATVVGRFEDAEAYLSHSLETSHRIGAPFFAAWTNLLWARMLLERARPGDRDGARGLLAQAYDVAVAKSYGGIERGASESLTACSSEVGPGQAVATRRNASASPPSPSSATAATDSAN